MIKKIKELNFVINYKPLKIGYGYWDERKGEIVINTKQSRFYQDIILIHELLHLTASCLKQAGIIKKNPDHNFITNCSQQLLACFVLSGKWKGIKKSIVKNSIKKILS